MHPIAPEPARPGPSYPAEALRPRPNVDPHRVEFADFIEDKDPRSSTPRSQSERSREPNEGHRSNREAEPAGHRRQTAAEGESRSKATNEREPESLDHEHAEEARSADDQRVEPDRDLGEPARAPDDNAAADGGPETGQSSAASNHVPRPAPFAEAPMAETGPAQTGAAVVDLKDPDGADDADGADGADGAAILAGGREKRAGLAVTTGSTGERPAAGTGEAGEPAVPLAVPTKGRGGGTLLTQEPISADEGRPAQPQGVLSGTEAVRPGTVAGAPPVGRTKDSIAEALTLPQALTDETLPQQNQGSGPAATGTMLHESGLARSESPISAAGTVMPGARGTTATASSASPSNTPPAAVPFAKLGVEIASQAQAGRQRFDIRLDPPELGQVHVRLDVDRDGHVTSRLVVDRAETLDLLRRDAPQLERALQDAGLKTDSQTMQFLLRDQGSGQERARQDSSGGPEPAGTTTERNTEAEDASANYSRNFSPLGGLDIRV